MIAVHALIVLAAFTLAALATYAVVLAVLTAASSASGEPWLDADADDDPEGRPEPREAPVSC